jgi:hypothetical protein
MANQRYIIQSNLNIYRTVLDMVTGRATVVGGMVMDMLSADEAFELAGRLNWENQERLSRMELGVSS